MARYIDADTTIKAIRDRFNIYFEVPCDSDDRRVQEIIGKVKKVIQEHPTADVVPKSEVEELKQYCSNREDEVMRLYDANEELSRALNKAKSEVLKLQEDVDRLQEINNRQVEDIKLAKREVAREIFMDIDRVVEKYSMGDIEYPAFLNIIAELKKKYTEGK